MNSIGPGGKTVMTCSECGEKSPFIMWKNGALVCSDCDDNVPEMQGKSMARSWDEFRGAPRKPKSERERT